MCKDATPDAPKDETTLTAALDSLDLNSKPSDEEIVLRGGADKSWDELLDGADSKKEEDDSKPTLRGCAAFDTAAFDDWADAEDADDSATLARGLEEMAWDGNMVEQVLLSAAGEELMLGQGSGFEEMLANASLAVQIKPHRVEPLTPGGQPENLVHSLRQFNLEVALCSSAPLPDCGLALRVTLVFADTCEEVPPLKGEAPLAGETEARIFDGRASFRLRVAALSYKHNRRPFALLARPADPARAAQLPSLAAVSAPFRGVARLPNENPANATRQPSQQQQPMVIQQHQQALQLGQTQLAHATPTADAFGAAPAAAAAAAAAQLAAAQAVSAAQLQLQPYRQASPASSFSATSSPPPSPPNSHGQLQPPIAHGASWPQQQPPPQQYGGGALESEVQQLRMLLEQEAAGREAYREAFEQQQQQLQMLAEQQARILQQMQQLRAAPDGGFGGAPAPAAQQWEPPAMAAMPGLGW